MTTLLIIIYISFISLGLPDSLLGTAWPTMYSDLSVPIAWAGILSFIVQGGTIISSLVSNKLIRRFGTGVITAGSVTLTAIALLGISFSSNFWMMLIFCIPLGLGAGSVDVALNNFVALHYRAKHMNWLHSFWGIGATAGPIIMSFWLTRNSWKSGYATIGYLQILLVAVLIVSLPLWAKFQTKAKSENNKDTVKILSLRQIIKIKGAKPILIAFFSYCVIEATAGLWGSSFLVLSHAISAEIAASFISLYYFGITLGRLVSGFLTMRINNKTLIRIGQGLIVIGILLLLIPTVDLILCFGFLFIGLGCAPIYPSMLHDTPKNFGKDLSQSVMGIQMAFSYIGATFMPPLFGFLVAHTTMSILPYYLIVFLAILFVMIERVNRIKTDKIV